MVALRSGASALLLLGGRAVVAPHPAALLLLLLLLFLLLLPLLLLWALLSQKRLLRLGLTACSRHVPAVSATQAHHRKVLHLGRGGVSDPSSSQSLWLACGMRS